MTKAQGLRAYISDKSLVLMLQLLLLHIHIYMSKVSVYLGSGTTKSLIYSNFIAVHFIWLFIAI